MEKGTGANLWIKAKKLIPTGNQLLSKRSERFLPEFWPSYYSKAKGCEIWDLDGNHFYDFAQMGVGSCVLGYSNDEINDVVFKAVSHGAMSSLNSFEEVELAEKLVDLHPWAEMARFARTGGEACSIAIRIARAASGKDKVAFCGYHGWHDWYISSNINDKGNLDDQLLPGLKPNGVPRNLANTSIPFFYNDIDSLKNEISKNPDIGVIIMEPQRSENPKEGFLESVREAADKIGAVLIFDEVTSGFRINNGGIHLTYGVEPDIAVFGKALGNGHPISAIIGRRSVMEAAQSSFISSTFWTERIGYVAALKTLKIIERDKVYNNLVFYGNMINQIWEKAASGNNLNIHISGIPPLTHINFEDFDQNLAQTFYTQEMLKRGYLLGASVYATNAYTSEILSKFAAHTEEVFELIDRYREGLVNKLNGPVIESGFKRLN